PCRSIAFRHVAPRSGALMAGGVVVGGVNETGPRRPLPGARILVESQNSAGNPVARRTVSGLDGSYLFVDLPPGAYLATGMQRGFASGQARFVGAPGERVFRPIFLQRLVPSPQPEPNEPEPNQP
ncbi:MAG: carboxypeptidase regulatory-like domain-containing protein, partial [Phycisphaerales bacterium]|nr:carboxypeptidase regulatory-like domain-containing protein [Phycisphaerales bacterium]